MVVDGQEVEAFDKTLHVGRWPIFSPDSRRVAYAAGKGTNEFVVVDGQHGPEYDEIAEEGPVFSPDSKRLAYQALKNQRWFVVLDGQEGPEYECIIEGRVTFLADGTLVYLAGRDKTYYRVKHPPPLR